MSTWPARFHKPVISTFSREALGAHVAAFSNATPSTQQSTALQALYIPFTLHADYLVVQVWWHNGSVLSGNVDCGVYDSGGTGVVSGNASKLFSCGPTGQSGASVAQSFTLATPYLLTPGVYYMAMATASAAASFLGPWGVTSNSIAAGVLTQATAYPLPQTATFQNAISFRAPMIGISSGSVI